MQAQAASHFPAMFSPNLDICTGHTPPGPWGLSRLLQGPSMYLVHDSLGVRLSSYTFPNPSEPHCLIDKMG